MKINDNKKSVILIILIVVLVTMTIAYAAFQTNLSVAGNVGNPQTKWDIHFDNFSSASTPATTSLGETNTGVLKSVSTNATKIDSLKVDLKKPGDKIVYTFDIENEGTMDAKLASYSSSIDCGADVNCSYASYTFSCLDSNSSNALVVGSNLSKNAVVNCTLTIKYNEEATISDDVGATFSTDLRYVQK